MFTRRKLWLLLFLPLSACVVIAVLFSIDFAAEPRFQGVQLSQWISFRAAHKKHQLFGELPLPFFRGMPQDPVDPRELEAENAIQQIGSNALPTLLKWINAQPNSLEIALVEKIYGKPGSRRSSVSGKLIWWLNPSRVLKLRSQAYNTLFELGPKATPAIPELEKIACNPKAPGAELAADILIHLKAVPSLINVLKKSDNTAQRIHVLRALGRCTNSPATALPAIITCVKSLDADVAANAVELLGESRLHPELSVPVLIEALDDPRYSVRLNAVKALGWYGHQAESASPKLNALAVSVDLAISRAAERSLGKISDQQSPFESNISPAFLQDRTFRLLE
ncbi:MAG: HEAT repeat domain-containing protein [Verrucomicrobiota bacterium]